MRRCLQAALHSLIVLVLIWPRAEHKLGNKGHSAAKEMSFYGQQLTFLVKTVEQFGLIRSKAVKIQCNPYQNSQGSPCRERKKS